MYSEIHCHLQGSHTLHWPATTSTIFLILHKQHLIVVKDFGRTEILNKGKSHLINHNKLPETVVAYSCNIEWRHSGKKWSQKQTGVTCIHIHAINRWSHSCSNIKKSIKHYISSVNYRLICSHRTRNASHSPSLKGIEPIMRTLNKNMN